MNQLTFIALMLSTAFCAGAAPASDFVTRQGAKLYLNGKEYRAIGVNIPHLHQAYLGTWFHNEQKYGTHEAAKQAIIDGIEDAGKNGLAFIRFFADPGYPKDREMLYVRDPEAYWNGMDELFALCRENNIKLIPSLQTIPGPYLYYGETAQAILDPDSLTCQAVQKYITEFVTRYKDDPTVLMWELQNEAMLAADVDMTGWKLPPAAVYPPGLPARETGVREDSLNWDMIIRLYKEHAAFIKSLDPNHLVTSGDAIVRPECTSRRETFPDFKYRVDTWREWLANNLASQPDPLDVYSFHFYAQDKIGTSADPWVGMNDFEYIQKLVSCAHAANSPVFIGELGSSPDNQSDTGNQKLIKTISILEDAGVSLMALWVWHFNWQPELTLDSQTNPEVVKTAGDFNRKYAQ